MELVVGLFIGLFIGFWVGVASVGQMIIHRAPFRDWLKGKLDSGEWNNG